MAVAVIAALTPPGVTRRIDASDEVQYVAFLRSLWFDGDVSFDNEYRQFYANGTTRDPMFAASFIEPATETGLRRNFGTIGSPLLWAPFYAAADAGVRVARALDDALAHLGGHRDERRRLGETACQRVWAEFRWAAHCRELGDAMRQAMGRRGR